MDSFIQFIVGDLEVIPEVLVCVRLGLLDIMLTILFGFGASLAGGARKW